LKTAFTDDEIDLALRLNLLPAEGAEKCRGLCEEVGKMLHGLATAICRHSH